MQDYHLVLQRLKSNAQNVRSKINQKCISGIFPAIPATSRHLQYTPTKTNHYTESTLNPYASYLRQNEHIITFSSPSGDSKDFPPTTNHDGIPGSQRHFQCDFGSFLVLNRRMGGVNVTGELQDVHFRGAGRRAPSFEG